MAVRPAASVIRELQNLFDYGPAGDRTDAQLLDQFRAEAGARSEVAFEILVARHGPMVLRVCRQILNDEHDAQDAFQATFLVLVRQAASVRKRNSLASWLHGVAHRVASRARVDAARRRVHEQRMVAMNGETRRIAGVGGAEPLDDPESWTEVHRRILDEEIRRLPENYRAPIVLCYLEGMTQERASEQLGWPSGTVRGRLARARALLRERMLRRGLAVPAAVLAFESAAQAATAAGAVVLPRALVASTVRSATLLAAGKAIAPGAIPIAALGLADGVLRAAAVAKVKLVAAVLICGAVAAGGGLAAYYAATGDPSAPAADQPARPGLRAALAALTSAVAPSSPRPQAQGRTPGPVSHAPGSRRGPDPVPTRTPSAIAVPMPRITVDGDLGDWPAGLVHYPIDQHLDPERYRNFTLFGRGRSPETSTFRVGYNAEDQRIYLAVEVADDHPAVRNNDAHQTDGVEVYVDGLLSRRTIPVPGGDWRQALDAARMPALQYAGVPGPGRAYGDPHGANPSLVYGDVRRTTTAMATARQGGVTTYEWAIQAFDRYPDRPTRLAPGVRIGLDVAVVDWDGPGRENSLGQDWRCWAASPTSFKGCDAGQLGELILGEPR